MIDLLEKFKDVKVLVIGDVMLDHYWWGSVGRISPEAPVPVVNLSDTTLVVGGAANVAANIAGLGAKPILIGVIGNDDEGQLFVNALADCGVQPDHLIKEHGRPTTVKTRIIAHSQHVVRVDKETSNEISPDTETAVLAHFENAVRDADAVVVSDYAKGLLTERTIFEVIRISTEAKKPVLVDPKGKDYRKYKGATLLTPNKREAAEAANLLESAPNLVETAGKILIEDLGLQALLVTRGEEGMTLFQNGSAPQNFSAMARQVYDVTGAGDTVIAALATAYGAGSNITSAVELANIAAGYVVEDVGTTVISREKLEKFYKESQV